MAACRALGLLVVCATLAVGVRASAREIAVYGLELEVSAERERLLIFADAPVEPKLIPVDDRTIMIALPGTALDASAPTDITPTTQGTITRVTAFDRAEGKTEVRVVVQRRPGAEPRIERRASVVAVEFEPLPRAAPPAGTIRVSYKNTPIQTVISELARATGERIVFDDSVASLGTVTIEGPPQATRAEALALIDSILLLRGHAAVPAPGGVRKIVPINGAPAPWRPSGKIPDSDAPITTLLRLETAKAVDLVPVITPYLGANAVVAAFEPTNSLILSGPASLIATLRKAIGALDQIEAGEALIWPMRVADAETVADQLIEIAGERDVPYASSDKRMNALLLRVRPGEVEHVRELVDRLDRPAHGAARMQVVRLRYADPQELAEMLSGLRDEGVGGETEVDVTAKRAGLRGLTFQVAADEPTRSIVLSAAPEVIRAVFDVIDQIDRVPTSVRVQVTVASFDVDDRLDLGFDYLLPVSNPKNQRDLVAAVSGNPSGGGIQTLPSAAKPYIAAFTRAPLLIPILDAAGQTILLPIPRESASLSMNGRTITTTMLMQPSLVITSGKEHEIFAGDNVPIPVSRPEGSQSATTTPSTTGETTTPTTTGTTVDPNGSLQVRQNIERKDVGTSLRLTPTLGEQGGVLLQLRVEVSTVREQSLAGPVEDVGPTIGETTIESTIRLRGGEVAVIATAAQPSKQTTVTGAPWLMDIPILGWLFRFSTEQTLNHHLLIAARADVLRPETHELADRLARELERAPAAAGPSASR